MALPEHQRPDWRLTSEILSAALDLPPPERESYVRSACAGSPQLLREVESLLAAHQDSGRFLEPPTAVWEREGKQIGQWLLERRIGEGGMGVVYKASRETAGVRQTAALKMNLPGLAPHLVEQRYRSELQILASLDHPNITRLLDCGTSTDGVPYIAMEFVEGEQILEYCRTRSLDTRSRLRLFNRIAHTVHYAHQRLVVHRDLKPSNILVTAAGQPKLLDFGIARLLEPDGAATADATASIFRALSIDYASPEQLRGGRVTTATDIYSLGLVLFEMLTGGRRPPRMVPNLEQAAIAAENAALPRTGNPDLDAILAKATRPEPEERYGSAEQLAVDVERYLRFEPVAARKGTAFYVARKFARRHRLAVACASVALIATLAGAAAFAWQARAARAERAKAEARFQETRKIANRMIEMSQKQLSRVPGTLPFRRAMTKAGLKYLDALASESEGDPALLVELAQGYIRSGNLLGNLNAANLGDPEQAEASYEKAVRLMEAVLRRNSNDNEAAQTLSRASYRLSQLALEQRRYSRIAALISNFNQLAAPALKAGSAADRAALMGLQQMDAMGRAEQGDINAYRQLARDVDAMAYSRPKDAAERAQYASRLAGLLQRMVNVSLYMDDPAAAAAHAEKLIALVNAARPSGVVGKYRAATASLALGRAKLAAGQVQLASQLVREAVQSLRELSAAEPGDRQYKTDLAEALFYFGRTQAELRSGHAARAAFEESATRAIELSELPAAFPRLIFLGGWAALERARLEPAADRRCQWLQKADELFRRNEQAGVTHRSERPVVDSLVPLGAACGIR